MSMTEQQVRALRSSAIQVASAVSGFVALLDLLMPLAGENGADGKPASADAIRGAAGVSTEPATPQYFGRKGTADATATTEKHAP